MAVTLTNIPVQVIIGKGAPTAGDVVKGGVVLSLNAAGDKLDKIMTSTNGTNVVELQVPSTTEFNALKATVTAQAADDHLTSGNWNNTTNELTLTTSDGTVTKITIPDDKVLLVNDLTSGGTGKALSAEQGKTLKAQVDTKVTAVAGKGLISTADAAKVANLPAVTATVTTVKTDGSAKDTELATHKAIADVFNSLSVPTVGTY